MYIILFFFHTCTSKILKYIYIFIEIYIYCSINCCLKIIILVYQNVRKQKHLRPHLFDGKWFFENHFPNFIVFVCHQKSWSMKNTFQSKKNLIQFTGKCFSFILGEKHFPEVVKNLEMSYYLLITSNLVLKLLIAIYILF